MSEDDLYDEDGDRVDRVDHREEVKQVVEAFTERWGEARDGKRSLRRAAWLWGMGGALLGLGALLAMQAARETVRAGRILWKLT